MSDLVLARNCCLARMFPVGLSRNAKSVKRFERSNGLDYMRYIKTTFTPNSS